MASPAAATSPDPSAFLRARAAGAKGQAAEASGAYAAALAADPDNAVVAAHAYRAALNAGNWTLARRAAAILSTHGGAPADAGLLAIADAIAVDDRPGLTRALTAMEPTPLGFLVPSLRLWAGMTPNAQDLPATTATLGTRYLAEAQAMHSLMRGDSAVGLQQVQALLSSDPSRLDLRIDAAGLLQAGGDGQAAASLLRGSAVTPDQARAFVAGIGSSDLRFGAARLFDRLAADLNGASQAMPAAVTLSRAALRIAPADDRARLLLADSLTAQGDVDPALAALDGIAASSPFRDEAAGARVAVLHNAGRDDEALTAAKALATPDRAGRDDLRRYADLLMAADRGAAAAAVYARARAMPGPQDWTLAFGQAAALDQAGRWSEARPLLEDALKAAPQEPTVLNYLGYGLLSHGEDVSRARSLLERAHLLRPRDPAITDSLGYAYLRSGDLAAARPLLEAAAKASPADPEINEHLGDLYWQSGRSFEARYAWRAARLTADAPDATRIDAKLAQPQPRR